MLISLVSLDTVSVSLSTSDIHFLPPDGKTPAGISQTNVTNKDVKQESGSVSFTAPFMGVSALVVISSVFAVLA